MRPDSRLFCDYEVGKEGSDEETSGRGPPRTLKPPQRQATEGHGAESKLSGAEGASGCHECIGSRGLELQGWLGQGEGGELCSQELARALGEEVSQEERPWDGTEEQ